MPFTSVTQLPEGKPSVRIFLTGQLLLQPNAAGDACEVFVNRRASNHHLTIEVREKFEGEPDFILMRHQGPLEYRSVENPVEGLVIRRQANGKLSAYMGEQTPFGEAMAAIDLSKRDFHPGKDLTIDFEGARPSIMITDGIFHTAAKTPANLKFAVKRSSASPRGVADSDTKGREIPGFANIIGANIYLGDADDDNLILEWSEMGLPQNLTLTKPKEEGVTYEIYIINDPLYVDVEAAEEVHDEFAEYYKVLTNVPKTERLKMEMTVLDIEVPRGSARTPCMPVVVGDGG